MDVVFRERILSSLHSTAQPVQVKLNIHLCSRLYSSPYAYLLLAFALRFALNSTHIGPEFIARCFSLVASAEMGREYDGMEISAVLFAEYNIVKLPRRDDLWRSQMSARPPSSLDFEIP